MDRNLVPEIELLFYFVLQDSERLIKTLPNVVRAKEIPDCTHYDFLTRYDLMVTIYDEIKNLLRNL